MVTSIIDDIKREFAFGNKITRLILINLGVFIAFSLFKVFTHFPGSTPNAGLYYGIFKYVTLSKDWIFNLMHPWVFFTHMFIHIGLRHFIWNMLIFYWFGKIVGDLLGDKHVYPIYFYGGLASAFSLLLSISLFGYVGENAEIFAHGASGAVMAFVVLAGLLNPEGIMNLILIGPVRLKYVSASLVLLDILMIGTDPNTGGIFGHLGGAAMGWFYIYALRNGWNLSPDFTSSRNGDAKIHVMSDRPSPPRSTERKIPSKTFKNYFKTKDENSEAIIRNIDAEIDRILEKIKKQGIESLTDSEKNTLDQVSNDE